MDIFTQRGGFVIDISSPEDSLTISNKGLNVNTSRPHSSRFKFLSSGFQLGAVLPWGRMAMSGGFFGCCSQGVCGPGTSWVEARDAAQDSAVHRTAPLSQDYQTLHDDRAKVDKPRSIEKNIKKKKKKSKQNL